MDLAAISAFVEVGNRRGFRAAAATLGMSSAGVSKAVARLEEELGVALLARTTRSVRLTPAGFAFHARCASILADLEFAGKEAAEGASVPTGRLVISMSRAFGRLRVLPVVADFMRLHPQIEVEARLSDRVVDLVEDGVDLAVRIGHLPDSSMIGVRVGQTAFALSASPAYLAARGVPKHPDDLVGHTVVGYVAPGTASRFSYRFVVDGAIRTISLPARLVMDDGEALVDAGARSVGLVMANDYLMASRFADGTLVRVLREFETPPLPISVVHLPNRKGSPAIRAFTAMLRSRLAEAA
ncbi:LysR family transcriptional regulator [Sphingomonas sp. BK580]|uniref:LysR family transcriptional regulator n=1 Tax=Sphingomonas sp. BK580 TaxID=2586972 RepID=UPI0016145060|nr:LysR family transcriptional regulator [Sphingomonas sp. BK580]MBB3695259.1 DNA-binding transcriptional LysR family regulator [Sphingomonas sp. BK580]